jgi:hypothetical protein
MAAGTYNFTVEQGTTLHLIFTWLQPNRDPEDVTDYSARMQIRETIGSASTIASFTDADALTVGDTDGVVTLDVDATETASWSFKKAVYDLELESPEGIVTRLVKGTIILDPGVTR